MSLESIQEVKHHNFYSTAMYVWFVSIANCWQLWEQLSGTLTPDKAVGHSPDSSLQWDAEGAC